MELAEKNGTQNKQDLLDKTKKFRDPHYLPTRKEVLDSIPTDLMYGKYIQFSDGSQMHWADLFKFDDGSIFEILTREYIEALSDYLLQRIKSGSQQSPIILEVGAGNGRLSYMLHLFMGDKAKFVATDPHAGSKNKWDISPLFSVEPLSYQEALKKYNPQIVLCSWMPFEDDWSWAFRQNSAVQEYILIGDTFGACGEEWETWGERKSGFTDKHQVRKDELPPYKNDGFEQVYLKEISQYQIEHNDKPNVIKEYGESQASATVSFQRTDFQPLKNDLRISKTGQKYLASPRFKHYLSLNGIEQKTNKM